MQVPFNKPGITARELGYIQQAADRLKLSGNGDFTKLCHQWLESKLGVRKALLTHSGTAALEMAAILSGVGPGDEVIMPSFTFSSTANAFVLRGATPVFVDVQRDTLNLDPDAVSDAITPSTKAIVPVHYAGVACDMVRLTAIAQKNNLAVIEDAAQALCSSDHGRALGTIGGASALSFHETKNIIAGEGGALLITDPAWAERAEIVWEKGTNRAAFSRGEVDKYTWVDIGSSFLPGEITAAFLWGQFERADAITAERLRRWQAYHEAFAPLEQAGLLRRPVVPAETVHNGHIYFLIYPDAAACSEALAGLRARDIDAVRHYVPLHSAPAGLKFARTHGSLDVTTDLSARLVRLPLWVGIDDEQTDRVVEAVWQVTQVK